MVIVIKKILKIFGNIGKGFCFILLLIMISIGIISFKMTKENKSNPFCKNKYENINLNFDYKEILNCEYYYECSTLYVILKVDKTLSKEDTISLLLSIADDLNELDCFTHFEVQSETLPYLYATINLKTKEISYIPIN